MSLPRKPRRPGARLSTFNLRAYAAMGLLRPPPPPGHPPPPTPGELNSQPVCHGRRRLTQRPLTASRRQGCQVGPFRGSIVHIFPFFKSRPRNFCEFLSSWVFFKVQAYLTVGLFLKCLFSIKNLAFFKTKFGLFQLQAHGSPGRRCQSPPPQDDAITPGLLKFEVGRYKV